MPEWLLGIQWLDFTARENEADYYQGVEDLIKQIQKSGLFDVDTPSAKDPVETLDWMSYLQRVIQNPDYNRWVEHLIGEGQYQYIQERLLPITIHEYDLQIGGRARKGKQGLLVEIGLNPAQKNLLILGDPGTGKTTGLEKIIYEQAAKTLQDLQNKSQDPPRIPLLVSLKEYTGSLIELLFNSLQKGGITVQHPEHVRNLLSSPSQTFLIMLDGLNEVVLSSDGQSDLPARVAEEIREITTRDIYQHHRFIVTCRIRDYKPPLTKISWDGYGIEELKPKDVIDYLDARLEPKQNGTNIYYSLESRLRDLLKNPQLLYMFSEIRQAGFAGQVKNRGQLYDGFIAERLLLDENKLPSKYSRSDKRLVLAVTGFWHFYETGGPGVFSDSRIHTWMRNKLDEAEFDFVSADRPKWRHDIFGELRSNVLLKMAEDGPKEQTFMFYHQSYEEFSAAYYIYLLFEDESALRNPPDISISDLGKLVHDDKWAEPLVLLSGILVDTSSFLRILAKSNAVLAGRCLVEGKEPNDELVINEIVSTLFVQFDTGADISTAELLYNLKTLFPSSYNASLMSLYPSISERTRRDALVHKNAGRKLQQTGKWDAARALYLESRTIIEKGNQSGELDCILAVTISDNADLDDVEGKNYVETQIAHEQAIKLVENSANTCEEIEIAEIYRRYGFSLRYQNNWSQSLDAFTKTLNLVGSLDSHRGKSVRGEALLGIGKTYLEQDQFDEAKSYFQQAESLFRELDDDFNLAQALQKMGEVYMGLALSVSDSDPQRKVYIRQSQNYMEDSRDRKLNRGDLFGIGITLDQLGVLSEIDENYEQAKTYQRQSIDSKKVLKGDKRGFVRSLCGLARAFAASGEIREAKHALEDAKGYLVPLIDWEMYGEYHRSKGVVILKAIEQGIVKPDLTYMALGHLEQARQIWQQTNRPCRQARVNDLIDRVRATYIQKQSPFCEKCGGMLDFTQNRLSEAYYDLCRRTIDKKVRLHAVCGNCGSPKFANPKLGVAIIMETQEGIVLARRTANPYIGKWTLIAGYTEYDESPLQTGIRETFEEVGANVKLDPVPLGIYTFRDDPRADMVHIVYTGKLIGGTLRVGDDVSEVKGFSTEEIMRETQIAFEGNRQAIMDWVKRRDLESIDLKKKIWSFFMLYDDTPSM